MTGAKVRWFGVGCGGRGISVCGRGCLRVIICCLLIGY